MKDKKCNRRFCLLVLLGTLSVCLNVMIPASEERTISIAAVGDCIITRPLSPYAEENYLKLIELLRKADVAYGNMEGTIHDNKGYPAYKGWDVNLDYPPYIADELKWAGFDMMSMANNHALDFLIEGLLETQKHLDRVGIIHAGTGKNLEEASAPAYFESKNGRIALISCASSFPSYFLASSSRGDMTGRPGLNPLRLTSTYQVTEKDLEILKEIGAKPMPAPRGKDQIGEKVYSFSGEGRFKVGSKRGTVVEADQGDVERIIDAVELAKKSAHIVMVSIHAHNQAEYLKKFAHACIDAGADCLIGSGPHVLTGLEIYEGKPIFYSLGNFVFQLQTMKHISAEIYEMVGLDKFTSNPLDFWHVFRDRQAQEKRWLTIMPWMVFADGNLKELTLYPVTLNLGAERAGPLGRPFLADGETAEKIIEKMVDLSSPHGTQITYKDSVGVVRID